jgi:hypothetical protein
VIELIGCGLEIDPVKADRISLPHLPACLSSQPRWGESPPLSHGPPTLDEYEVRGHRILRKNFLKNLPGPRKFFPSRKSYPASLSPFSPTAGSDDQHLTLDQPLLSHGVRESEPKRVFGGCSLRVASTQSSRERNSCSGGSSGSVGLTLTGRSFGASGAFSAASRTASASAPSVDKIRRLVPALEVGSGWHADFRSFADAPLIAPIDNLWWPVSIAV